MMTTTLMMMMTMMAIIPTAYCSDKPHLKGKLERYISTKLPSKVQLEGKEPKGPIIIMMKIVIMKIVIIIMMRMLIKVKLMRLRKREGLIRARLEGARAATGEVVNHHHHHPSCHHHVIIILVIVIIINHHHHNPHKRLCSTWTRTVNAMRAGWSHF